MEIGHSRHFQINNGLWHLLSLIHKLSTSPRVQFRNINPKLTEKEMTNLKYYANFKSQELNT